MIHREVIEPRGDLDQPITVAAGAFTTTIVADGVTIILTSPEKTAELIHALNRCLIAQVNLKRKARDL